MICRTEGLVLRGYRMSESSKVVVLYSREYGKLRLVAKGARRPKSKFGASLEAITWGSYVYYTRENRELQTLSEGDILHSFDGIKQGYRRLAYGSVICDLLDHLTADEDKNLLLCSVVLDTLRWMERVAEDALELPLWYFQLKAASALGYRPHLSGCVQCGKRLSGARVVFSPVLGGTSCSGCATTGMSVSMDTVRFLEHLQVGRSDRIDEHGFQVVNRVEGQGLLRSFMNHHVEGGRKVNAQDFLDKMLAAERPAAVYRAGQEEVG